VRMHPICPTRGRQPSRCAYRERSHERRLVVSVSNWKGTVTQRPKYWGKLVMELVYEYLDKDVAKWLKENAPEPRHGQNYHQWLSGQYGLKKLVE
jgi:hypothetical protein